MKTPRKLSLVRFKWGALPSKHPADYPDPDYPFQLGAVYVFLGGIANMPGHCVAADHKTGQIYSGYHTENFVELTEDEV